MKFEIILSARGKEIFKGGNIEPMSVPLRMFKAKSKIEAGRVFDNVIISTVGSGSAYCYELKVRE